jgi:hypothetical protein
MSRICVFTGPTLDEETIRELLPEAEIYPPVAAGDLLRLPLVAGDLVAIIDGFYFQAASVRHKEILDLLQRGVHVWGAGSMGALRAAELAPFGMRGFGSVFQAYVDGEIDGDDEVAVLHTPQDLDYVKLTEALVNIRQACHTAVAEGLLSQEQAELVVRVTSALPFFERSYARIWQEVAEAGLAEQTIKALQTFVRQKRHDRKRADALAMLEAAQQFAGTPFHAPFQLQETSLLRDWKLAEQGLYWQDRWISDYEILTAYQLFGEDYPQVHRQCLTEQLAQIAWRALSASERARMTPPVTPQDRAALIGHFLTTTYGLPLEGPLPEDALRWLSPHEHSQNRLEQLIVLAIRLWHVARSQSWRAEMLKTLKATELYTSLAQLVYRTHQFNRQIQEQHHQAQLERLAPQKVQAWAMRRWAIDESAFEIALLDRGFKSTSAFLAAASTFYLFDKYQSVPCLALAQTVH